MNQTAAAAPLVIVLPTWAIAMFILALLAIAGAAIVIAFRGGSLIEAVHHAARSLEQLDVRVRSQADRITALEHHAGAGRRHPATNP